MDASLPYDALVIAAHPDDAEVQMGGTVAKLADRGMRVLFIDLCTGEPADYAVVDIDAAVRLRIDAGSDRGRRTSAGACAGLRYRASDRYSKP